MSYIYFSEIVAGALNLGCLISFISAPVISAFTSAVSIQVATSQVKGLLGLKVKNMCDWGWEFPLLIFNFYFPYFLNKGPRLGGRRFFGDELRQANYIHFLKAYALWIAIVRLKREVVESVFNIKFQKN